MTAQTWLLVPTLTAHTCVNALQDTLEVVSYVQVLLFDIYLT